MKREGKVPKYIWLPALLTLYFIGMSIAFVPELLQKGEYTRVAVVSVVEIVVIILVYLFYKKRAGK